MIRIRKVILLTLLISLFIVVGCNQLDSGEVIYKAEQDFNGEWHHEKEETESNRFILITEENIFQIKNRLKNISHLIHWNLDGKKKFELKDELILKDEFIIYVTLGECPSSGYKIKIKKVVKKRKI